MMMARSRPSLSGRNGLVALALVTFIASVASTPLLVKHLRESQGKGALFSQKEALKGNQVMRGAYINSGSKDIGADPDYDHATGVWHGKRNG